MVPSKEAQEAVLGAALAIALFWGVTFTLMLVSTYLPAARLLAKRAQALLQDGSLKESVPASEEWLREHGLFLSLQDHLPQFGLMLAPLLASEFPAARPTDSDRITTVWSAQSRYMT